MVLLGLVIIFCVGILGDFLLRLEGLETTSNQQSVEEIVQAIPKGLILIFAGVIGPIFEEGIFRVGIQAFSSQLQNRHTRFFYFICTCAHADRYR